jgi:hypothetical protein
MWLGVAALLAGAFALGQLATSEDPAAAVVLAVLFLGPPLVVLHFVLLLRLVRLRLGFFTSSNVLRTLLAARMLSLGAFMHPWYWALLAGSTFACFAIVPVALAIAIF